MLVVTSRCYTYLHIQTLEGGVLAVFWVEPGYCYELPLSIMAKRAWVVKPKIGSNMPTSILTAWNKIITSKDEARHPSLKYRMTQVANLSIDITSRRCSSACVWGVISKHAIRLITHCVALWMTINAPKPPTHTMFPTSFVKHNPFTKPYGMVANCIIITIFLLSVSKSKWTTMNNNHKRFAWVKIDPRVYGVTPTKVGLPLYS